MNKFLLSTLASLIAITASTASPDLAGAKKADIPPPLSAPPAPLLPPPHKKTERLKHILLVRDLLIRKYDTNGDGKLDATEKKTLLRDAEQEKKNARKAFLKRHDLDGDGKLSKEERDALHSHMGKRHKRVFPAPPPPHQGKSSDHPPKGFRPHPHMVMKNRKNEKFIVSPSVFMLELALLLKKYDTNGNGVIDPEEFGEIRKDADILYVLQIQKLLATYDKNNNGTLSDEEKTAITRKKSPADTDSELDDAMDDIDLFIQASFDEELLDSLEEDE